MGRLFGERGRQLNQAARRPYSLTQSVDLESDTSAKPYTEPVRLFGSTVTCGGRVAGGFGDLTLTSNGDGSDQGWGSHHFVVGGGVAGQQFFGTLPTLAVNGPDDVGQGRLLPTTSVDQLGAALATWFGVSATDLPLVLPHVGNFNLGTLPLFG